MHRYFKKIDNGNHVLSWKSKELSDKNIKTPSTAHNSLVSSMIFVGTKIRVKFEIQCLKQDKNYIYP